MDVSLKIDDALKEDQKVWRYMDLAKFISMLETRALWLARADTFRDRHEGRFPNEMRDLIEKAYQKLGANSNSPIKDADDFQDYLLKNTFISCWHENVDENMVMWEIYGRGCNVVAVQATVGGIRKSVVTSGMRGHSLTMKRVDYKKADEVLGALRYGECFFIKRPHFSFEKEVRINFDSYSHENPNKSTPNGHKLQVEIDTLIGSVLVHPDSPGWFHDVVNSIKVKYGVRAPVERGTYGVE